MIAASHNGEPVHVGTVRAVLERAGLDADALRNPPGWPLDAESMAASQHKHKLLHNCSGKHAGMLLACVRAGWDPATYLRAEPSAAAPRDAGGAARDRHRGPDDGRGRVRRAGARHAAALDGHAVRAADARPNAWGTSRRPPTV